MLKLMWGITKVSDKSVLKFTFSSSSLTTWFNNKADHGDHIDRISDLPGNVIDGILEHLNIVDMVRTSTLSRKWRHMWVSVPKLEFEDQFFKNCRHLKDSEICRVITEVLFLHNGPVYKFTLHIPYRRTIRIECLSEWILFLSSSGIKHLEFVNLGIDLYQIPSHVFSCRELTYFTLHGFKLSVLPDFCGFKRMLVLNFFNIKFEAGALEGLISGCPLLEELTISCCTGFESIDVSGPTLKVLHICSHLIIKSICLKKAKNLIDLILMANGPGNNFDRGRVSDLIEGLPKIQRLVMGEAYIKILSACTTPLMLEKLFCSLRYLHLKTVYFNERGEILFIVSLLKSAPNLVELVIENKSLAVQQVWDYSKELECNSCCLSQLQIVTIEFGDAYKYALDLARFILANSLSLETLTFKVRFGVFALDEPKVRKVSQELSMMERASQRAEVKFLHWGITEQ